MRNAKMILTFLVFLLGMFVVQSEAQQNRPCGPSSLNGPLKLLIPQGAAGASFKSSCSRHDQCYATPGADKSICDQQFLYDLNCACNGSRNPRRCRRRAMKFYKAVTKWGDGAFDGAQRQAIQYYGM